MANSTNQIRKLVSEKLVGPAYVTMFGSLVVRGVIAIISGAVAYNTWPELLRILIELAVALGIIASGELILSASSSQEVLLQQQIRELKMSDRYTAPPRLKGANLKAAQDNLDRKRQLDIEAIATEAGRERIAMFFGGIISTIYGVGFTAANAGPHTNPFTLGTEIASLVATPFIVFYFSARYKEPERDVAEGVTDIALLGAENTLRAAAERLAAGTHNNEDVNAVAEVLPTVHKRIVKTMLKPDKTVKFLTSAEIFSFLRVDDESTRRTFRSRIRKAGMNAMYGVVQDEKTNQWKVPQAALIELFGDWISEGSISPNYAVRAERGRKRPSHKPKTTQPPSGSDPDVTMAVSGADAEGAQGDATLTPPEAQEPPIPIELEQTPLPASQEALVFGQIA